MRSKPYNTGWVYSQGFYEDSHNPSWIPNKRLSQFKNVSEQTLLEKQSSLISSIFIIASLSRSGKKWVKLSNPECFILEKQRISLSSSTPANSPSSSSNLIKNRTRNAKQNPISKRRLRCLQEICVTRVVIVRFSSRVPNS